MPELKTTSLQKALTQLEKGIQLSLQTPDDELARDGVIQRFEYTMDLCWKLLQRYLKEIAQIGEEVIRTKKDLFREGARLKLLADPEAWFKHYDARNETSHIYDSIVAQRVFERAIHFASDARELLRELQEAIRRSA